jgi:hypothetical protein
MATTETQSSGMGTGLVLGILVVILAVIALVMFGGGNYFRMGGGSNTVVPEKVDVNVNGGTGGTQGQ